MHCNSQWNILCAYILLYRTFVAYMRISDAHKMWQNCLPSIESGTVNAQLEIDYSIASTVLTLGAC